MKRNIKILSALLCMVLLLSVFVSCKEEGEDKPEIPNTDYVAELKLDMSSDTLKQKVTVKNYVDGDTTHFNVPTDISVDGVLKARYLAINTPESTGKIEEYGKKASNFTKEKLKNAVSIYIESDDNKWNLDSTGGRYLVWVWYQPSEGADYRNLNLEILQNGLAVASKSGNNRYGTVCLAALSQATAQKLNVHSGQKDPDFYYGEAIELTLKELRCDLAANGTNSDYNNKKVAFEAVVVQNDGGNVYVETYDEETGLYYGMAIYLGYSLQADGAAFMNIGNKVRIVGTVQYYETGGTWQVSGLSYSAFRPDSPDNLKLISSGNKASYILTDAKTLMTGKVKIGIQGENENGEEIVTEKEFAYGTLVLNTSVSMENLKVVDIYTTKKDTSASKGAMTLTCKAEDGTTVTVRTEVLYDADNKLVTQDAYEDQTINVRGIIDFYEGNYQIRVYSVNDLIIQ